MKREHFIIHLTELCNCVLVKHDKKKGWIAFRNPINNCIHAVPSNDPWRAETIRVICKNLAIVVPDCVKIITKEK